MHFFGVERFYFNAIHGILILARSVGFIIPLPWTIYFEMNEDGAFRIQEHLNNDLLFIVEEEDFKQERIKTKASE